MPRKRPSARRRRRGRFNLVLKLLSVALIVAAIVLALTLFFKVETIAVEGEERYTEEEIRQISGIRVGDNLFLINKYNAAAAIYQKLPYIKSAGIFRRFPSTIIIQVEESAKAGVVSASGGRWIINANGKIMEQEGFDGEAPDAQTPDSAQEPDGTQTPDSAQEPDGTQTPDGTQAPDGTQTPDNTQPSDGTQTPDDLSAEETAVAEIDGLEPVEPAVGQELRVGQEQEEKLAELKALLSALEAGGLLGKAQAIHLGDAAQLRMEYDGRFEVLIPWGSDYTYKLRSLETVISKLEANETGTIDMLRENGEVHFLP